MELDCCEAVGEGRRGTGKVDMMQASWPYYADGDDMVSLSSALHTYICRGGVGLCFQNFVGSKRELHDM